MYASEEPGSGPMPAWLWVSGVVPGSSGSQHVKHHGRWAVSRGPPACPWELTRRCFGLCRQAASEIEDKRIARIACGERHALLLSGATPLADARRRGLIAHGARFGRCLRVRGAPAVRARHGRQGGAWPPRRPRTQRLTPLERAATPRSAPPRAAKGARQAAHCRNLLRRPPQRGDHRCAGRRVPALARHRLTDTAAVAAAATAPPQTAGVCLRGAWAQTASWAWARSRTRPPRAPWLSSTRTAEGSGHEVAGPPLRRRGTAGAPGRSSGLSRRARWHRPGPRRTRRRSSRLTYRLGATTRPPRQPSPQPPPPPCTRTTTTPCARRRPRRCPTPPPTASSPSPAVARTQPASWVRGRHASHACRRDPRH